MATTLVRSESKFGFAYGDSRFSNATLVLSCKTSHADEKAITALYDEEETSSSTTARKISINTALLAAESRVFRAMLTSDFKESTAKEIIIEVVEHCFLFLMNICLVPDCHDRSLVCVFPRLQMNMNLSVCLS